MSSKSVDVVIVGAGMAGIKAAADLTQAGFSIAVLEGRDRLGGRLHTDRTSGSKLYELGCSWFHQSLDNPLLKLALDENLDIKPQYDDNGPGIYDGNGPLDGSKKLGQAAADFGDFASLYFKSHPEINDLSLKEIIDIFTSEHRLLTDTQKAEVKRILQIPILPNGSAASDVSAKYNGLPALGRDVLPVGGYDIIYNYVKKPVAESDIHLNTIVTEITKESNNTVTVATENGDKYTSKYVIVTVPIGVLKANAIQFSPALPAPVSSAIENLGVSKLGKVYFEFDTVFWPETLDKFVYVGDIEGEYAPALVSNWYLFNGEKKHPGLFVIVSSRIISKIEANPSCAFDLLKPVLEAIRVDQATPVPAPTRTKSTNWNTDRFTLGAISRAKIGTDPAGPIAAFANGFDNVRFAGEHTILDGFTFVHGAWCSGAREAKYIIDGQSKI